MNLYFIACYDFDWFVQAETPEQAVRLWQLELEDDDLAPEKVFLVPEIAGGARALDWHVDVKEVT